MHAEIDKLRALEEMRLFDLIRTAVNGDKDAARSFYDSLRERAGIEPPEKQSVIAASAEEFRKLLGRR